MLRFITIIAVILAAVLIFVFYTQVADDSSPIDTDFRQPPVVDVGPAPSPDASPPPELGPYTARLSGGGFINVEGIVQHPDTEVLADGVYQVSDSFDEYTIYYNEYSSVIFIQLYATPLGLVRLQAERKLIDLLPLQDSEICEIDISVTTNPFVDQNYSGQELGLSFCANYVALPRQ